MSRTDRALILLTLALVGIWGCAQSGDSSGPSADRFKALEAKNAKLEEDFRAVVTARDQLRRRLSATEEQQQSQQKPYQRPRWRRDNEARCCFGSLFRQWHARPRQGQSQ